MASVPQYPGVIAFVDPDNNDIRAATPVLGGGQWQAMANAAMWVLGRGANIAAIGPYLALDSTNGFPCYSYPHPQNLNWLWILSLSRTSSTDNVWGHFEGAQGTNLGDWQLDSSIPPHIPQHFFFIETFDPALSSAESFVPAVFVDSTSTSVTMAHLSATELPASSFTEFGASSDILDPATCATNAPIFRGSGGDRKSAHGMGAIARALTAGTGLIGEGRRATLFNWSSPVAVATSSGVLVDLGLFSTSLPSIVPRHMYSGVNTTTVRVAVFALVEGGTNDGEVVITAASGDILTIPITSGTPAWYFGDLEVKTEELDRNALDGGLRGGTRETFTVQGLVVDGDALGVFAVHIGESDVY